MSDKCDHGRSLYRGCKKCNEVFESNKDFINNYKIPVSPPEAITQPDKFLKQFEKMKKRHYETSYKPLYNTKPKPRKDEVKVYEHFYKIPGETKKYPVKQKPRKRIKLYETIRNIILYRESTTQAAFKIVKLIQQSYRRRKR